jgi:hypothetical protein
VSEAPKKTKTAVPVQEKSDGQPQVPTGAISGTVTKTKENVSGTETHVKSEYAVSTASESKSKTKSEKESATIQVPKTSILVHPKPSSGFITNSANATHSVSKPKPTTEIHTGAGSDKNTTVVIKPTTNKVKPTTFAPITSVAVATGAIIPAPAPTTASTSTTAPATATGAAQRVLAGGMLAGLGAVAAFVL